jgi:hypothetical protein
MAPSRTKENQIKPSKIAWISLVLFVRIGTFQWVTAEKIKKFLAPFCSPPGVSQDAGSIGEVFNITLTSDFRKSLRDILSVADDMSGLGSARSVR